MQINSLFSIIPPLRGIRVFQFSNSLEFSKELSKEAVKREFDLEIACTKEEALKELEKLKNDFVTVRYVPLDKKRYNLHSHLFDTLFINIPYEEIKDIEEEFFRKIYRMMKNAGVIVYPIKSSYKEEKRELLERLNYVAINDIDFDLNISVLTARKMHGWAKI